MTAGTPSNQTAAVGGHTPLPWAADGPDVFGDYNIVCGGSDEALAIGAVVSNLRPAKVVAANAALIVRAVNSHAALVEAVRAFVERFESGSRADTDYVASLMRAALQQAEAGDE